MRSPWPELDAKLCELAAQKEERRLTWDEIGAELGVSGSQARGRWRRIKDKAGDIPYASPDAHSSPQSASSSQHGLGPTPAIDKLADALVERIAARLEPIMAERIAERTAPTVPRGPAEPPRPKPKRDRPTHGKFIALFDIHHPENIPLDPIWKFAKDFKPDVLIFGGDVLDMAQLSHWNERKAYLLSQLPPPHEMFEEAERDIFVPARRAVGDSCYIVYLLGNHEDWARQAIEVDPRARDWTVERNLGRIPDEIIPFTDLSKPNIFQLGKLHFIHGYRTNMYHARYTADEFMRPVRYGHTHDVQQHAKVTSVDVREFFIARSCGCLCTRNPTYARNRPNRWVHAFCYGEVEESGHFFDEVPVIVHGRFYASGAVYGG